MRTRRKIILGLLIFVLLMLLLVSVYIIVSKPRDSDYYEKIITALDNKETITAGDVFSFEFDRAYILNDPYMSGEAFENTYNLGLSIKQVKNGFTDFVQRIVFVDKDGCFVYEFQCNFEELVIYEPGTVFYPETIIKEQNARRDGTPVVCFDSSERYGSKYAYLD